MNVEEEQDEVQQEEEMATLQSLLDPTPGAPNGLGALDSLVPSIAWASENSSGSNIPQPRPAQSAAGPASSPRENDIDSLAESETDFDSVTDSANA